MQTSGCHGLRRRNGVSVETEEAGSRVAVIEGEVHVRHGQEAKTLLPGEQVATTPSATLPPMSEEISWSKNFAGHLALLQRSVAVPTTPALGATTGTIRGVVRHALTGQPIPEAQLQLMPAAGVNLMPEVETFFSTLTPGTQLTPALLDELSAVQSAGGRPTMSAGPARGLRMGGPSGPAFRGHCRVSTAGLHSVMSRRESIRSPFVAKGTPARHHQESMGESKFPHLPFWSWKTAQHPTLRSHLLRMPSLPGESWTLAEIPCRTSAYRHSS